jgi:hypothetical protein
MFLEYLPANGRAARKGATFNSLARNLGRPMLRVPTFVDLFDDLRHVGAEIAPGCRPVMMPWSTTRGLSSTFAPALTRSVPIDL